MEYKDYYKILGVDRDADKATIKKAYRKLARKYHPDVSTETDAEAKFKDISEAYNVLKDEEKRAAYDDLGSGWQSGQDFRTPPGWKQAHSGFAGDGGHYRYYSTGADAGPDVSDFFESLFGHAGFADGRARGSSFGGAEYGDAGYRGVPQDQHASVQIDLADAFHGTTRQLSLSEPRLNQSGQLVNRQRTLKVRIPKGITEGQTMRLKGQGAADPQTGERGDLYLEVNFAPHPVYQVEGKNLSLELPVSPWEAALGSKVDVPLPDGRRVKLSLAPGSNSGKQLRLKGKGIPAREPGHLLVTLRIVNPDSLSESERKAFEALQQASGFDPREKLNTRVH